MSLLPRVFFGQEVELKDAPIRPEWILDGDPVAQNHVVFKSEDHSSLTLFWQCSAGSFKWVYDEDETIYVLDGGMTLTYPNGEVKAVGKGDVVYFAAGTEAVWKIDSHVHKLAVFRRPIPGALSGLLRVYHKAMSLGGKAAALGFGGSGQPRPPAMAGGLS